MKLESFYRLYYNPLPMNYCHCDLKGANLYSDDSLTGDSIGIGLFLYCSH